MSVFVAELFNSANILAVQLLQYVGAQMKLACN